MSAYLTHSVRLLLAVVWASFGSASISSVEAADLLNVLWIYLKDVSGWFSCYGDEIIKTPEHRCLIPTMVLCAPQWHSPQVRGGRQQRRARWLKPALAW